MSNKIHFAAGIAVGFSILYGIGLASIGYDKVRKDLDNKKIESKQIKQKKRLSPNKGSFFF
ncbi:hypothetical protein FACS1894132_04670 [Clostridia bacterium]|nr:hypothetical protein FACS1894132_04670 [Clostridia bacterium]